MEEDTPPPLGEDPVRTCAYSGERRPESQMVRIGKHFVAIEHKDAAVQFLHQGNELETPGSDMQAPPVRLGPLVSKAWEIFKSHWLLIMLVDLSVVVPVSVLQGFVTTQVDPMEQGLRLLLFTVAINGVFGSVGHAAVYAMLSRVWSGREPSYGSAWRITMARIGDVVLAGAMVMALVMIGMLMCIAPGFLASVWLVFTICFVMDDGRGAWAAVERSVRLAQGKFWFIFGSLIMLSIPLMVPVLAYEIAARFIPFLTHWLLRALVSSILATPYLFVVVWIFVLYKALRSESASKSW
jgi:hypothetical protein